MLLLCGLAAVRAGQLETRMIPLVVWDGLPGDGRRGTSDMVAHCRRLGHPVEVIAPDGSRRPCPGEPALAPREEGIRIMAILFADVVGFSRLTEAEVRRFVDHFLGAVAEVAGRHQPTVRNTWGDGLYFVFDEVGRAGDFALDLRDRVEATDWAARGLPADLSLRIALHAGPLYSSTDPVTGQLNYSGRHVSRAARIEPVTPPGEVYSSQAFVALAAAQGVEGFLGEYVGRTSWAKGFGAFPTYHVRRRGVG